MNLQVMSLEKWLIKRVKCGFWHFDLDIFHLLILFNYNKKHVIFMKEANSILKDTGKEIKYILRMKKRQPAYKTLILIDMCSYMCECVCLYFPIISWFL